MGLLDNIKGLVENKKDSGQTDAPAKSTYGKKVLIVEDEKMLSDALEMKFRKAGFTVLTAENGEVGLEIIVSEKPDIVLLDLIMPVMSGKTMLRRLREFPQFKTLPVIILTNAGDVNSMMETKTFYNAVEFLIKSNVSIEEIVAKVKALV